MNYQTKMQALTGKAERLTASKPKRVGAADFTKKMVKTKQGAESFFAKYLAEADLATLIQLSDALNENDIQRYNEIMDPIIRRVDMKHNN